MTQKRFAFGPGYLVLVAFAGLLALANAAASSRAPSLPGISIENFGKVNDHYYRGSQPKPAQLAELKNLGIKTVIDLRKDSERGAAQWARDAQLQYFDLTLK